MSQETTPLLDEDGIPILQDLVSPASTDLSPELRRRIDVMAAEIAAQTARRLEQQLLEQLPRLLEARMRELAKSPKG